MRLILQFCLCILVLLGTRTSSWGRMVCHEPATAGQAFIGVDETDPDALPMGVSSGEWLIHATEGIEDGPNVYAYVRQNPWTAFDPDGLAEDKVIQMAGSYDANTPFDKKLELRSLILSLSAPKGESLPRPITHLQYWLNTGRDKDSLEVPFAELQKYAAVKEAGNRTVEYFKSNKDKPMLGGKTLMDYAKAQPSLVAGGKPISLPNTMWESVVETNISFMGKSLGVPRPGHAELFFSWGNFTLQGNGSEFQAVKDKNGTVHIQGNIIFSAKDTYDWNKAGNGVEIPISASDLQKYSPAGVKIKGPPIGVTTVDDSFFKELKDKGYGRDFEIKSSKSAPSKIRFSDKPKK